MLFAFFTLSGSRRSYYVLPMVPFAIIMTADWILSDAAETAVRRLYSAGLVLAAFIFLFVMLDVAPAWYASYFGVNRFAVLLKDEANKVKPWESWNIVMLDAEEKLYFYLQLAPGTQNYHIKGYQRNEQTLDTLLKSWPFLQSKPANTIFISRKLYAPVLQHVFTGYRVVELPSSSGIPFMKRQDESSPVAYIPNN